MQEVTITRERYEQLIRAEHDANHLKAFITAKHENFYSLSREEIDLLYAIYVGDKEDSNV